MSLEILSSLVLLAPTVSSLVLPDGVGRLPALGWNSWNAYHCDVSEQKIVDAANLIVSLGLKDAGYEYVNIDDCWSVKSGRNANTSEIIPDPTTFPDGISGTADKVHGLGLKMGIYSSAGTATCAGYPASLGYEDIDAASFAAWGVDYLKYDNCNYPSQWNDQYRWCIPDGSRDVGPNGTCLDITNPAPPGYNWATSNSTKRYNRMRDALLAQNRTIQFSMCIWGTADVQSWANGTGSSYRMSGDIEPNWARILLILNEASFIMNYVGFWDHADTDMLEVGNGMSAVEERSHFALWALMKSPLIIGTNLANVSDAQVALLKNPYLLAFNQDPVYGRPAAPFKWGTNPDWTWNKTFPAEYWAGEFSNGTIIAMVNTWDSTINKTAEFKDIPGMQKGKVYELTDVWTGNILGKFSDSYTASVVSHDTAVILAQLATKGHESWWDWWSWWSWWVAHHRG